MRVNAPLIVGKVTDSMLDVSLLVEQEIGDEL